MFIGWSSTILRFGFSKLISFREEDIKNFSQSEHFNGPGRHVEYTTETKTDIL
jgi:hypothetical protein